MGTQLSPEKRGTARTQFLALVYCDQTAGWIRMPLGTEVNLGQVDVVLDRVAPPSHPKKKGHSLPGFGPCLLWPNGWMDQVAAWYAGRPAVFAGLSTVRERTDHATRSVSMGRIYVPTTATRPKEVCLKLLIAL